MSATRTAATSTVTSADGTTIAYEKSGTGPAVVLVDGALCWRDSGPMRPLAAHLVGDFTVYAYDRRGRGESSSTEPFVAQREIEDLAAVVRAAGGSARVFGISSGAAIVLGAANSGVPKERIAVYEAPFIVDHSRKIDPNFVETLDRLVAEDRRGPALKHFMRAGVGLPALMVAVMPLMPMWSKLKGVAPTLVNDIAFVGDFQKGEPLPADHWSAITAPTLVVDGGKSPQWMRNGMRSLAQILGAPYTTLAGQTHMVKPQSLAPVLREFFLDD
jgi:pimeloyl-ACP methyl ester carboxylesterase